MGLKELKQGLEKEKDQRTKMILDEAQVERKIILDKAQVELRMYKEQAKKNNDQTLDSLQKSSSASVNLSTKKDLLSTKKELIDDVFGLVLKELRKTDSKKRQRLLNNLVNLAKEQVDVKKIYCCPEDKNLLNNSFVRQDIKGGIVGESEDGKTSVDLTYETILAEIRAKHLKEVAGKLFA